MIEEYNIIYTTDDNFCDVMGVSILSLLENNKKMSNIQITIIESKVSWQNKRKINEICVNYNRQLPKWCKATDITQKLNMDVSVDRGSLSQYSRLFLNSFVREDVQKVLYLDCDTLIVGPLNNLWKLDLGKNVVCALKDAFSPYYRKNIDLDKNDIMFNSGVMLVDMNNWRNYNIEKKIFNFIIDKNGRVQQGDQGVLNSILSKYTLPLSPKYNAVSIFYEYSYHELLTYRKPVNFYPKEVINDAIKDVRIIHFTSAFDTIRPWIKGSHVENRNLWVEYYMKTPWSEKELREPSGSKVKKIIYLLKEILPRSLFINFFGFFQAYVRPVKNKFF